MFQKLLFLCALLFFVTPSLLLAEDVESLKARWKELQTLQYTGPVEGLKPFVKNRADTIELIADQWLALPGLSDEEIKNAQQIKYAGIVQHYYCEPEKTVQRIGEFADHLNQTGKNPQLVDQAKMLNFRCRFDLLASKPSVSGFKSLLNDYLPFAEAHPIPKERTEELFTNLGIICFSDYLLHLAKVSDPDHTAGLVLLLVEKTDPLLEAARKNCEVEWMQKNFERLIEKNSKSLEICRSNGKHEVHSTFQYDHNNPILKELELYWNCLRWFRFQNLNASYEVVEALFSIPDLTPEERLHTLQIKKDVLSRIMNNTLENEFDGDIDKAIAPFVEFLNQCEASREKNALGLNYSWNSVFWSVAEKIYESRSPKENFEKYSQQYVEFVKNNPTDEDSNPIAAFLVAGNNIDPDGELGLIESFAAKMIPVLENHAYRYSESRIDEINGWVNKRKRHREMLGSEMEFEMLLLDGNKLNLKDLKGKVVLLNFWATWCGPCIAKFPEMLKLCEEHGEEGFVIVSYSWDKDVDALREYEAEKKHPWYSGSFKLSKEAGMRDYFEVNHITGVPAMYLIDREGKVVGFPRQLDDAFREKLSRLLEK